MTHPWWRSAKMVACWGDLLLFHLSHPLSLSRASRFDMLYIGHMPVHKFHGLFLFCSMACLSLKLKTPVSLWCNTMCWLTIWQERTGSLTHQMIPEAGWEEGNSLEERSVWSDAVTACHALTHLVSNRFYISHLICCVCKKSRHFWLKNQMGRSHL